jgi:hypothetical protein
MSRIILTHVGLTALLAPALADFYTGDMDVLRGKLQQDRGSPHELAICIHDLCDGLMKIWSPNFASGPQAWRERSPAEIAALSLLEPDDGDVVLLLHSETQTGEFCARLIEAALQIDSIPPDRKYPRCSASQIRLKQLDGIKISGDRNDFDPRDPFGDRSAADSFVRKGLVGYVSVVWQCYQELLNQGGGELVFNITSGYRGLTPIARDLAILLEGYTQKNKHPVHCQMAYLFEHGQSLIRYDPFPVAINWSFVPEWKILDEASRAPWIVETRYDASQHAAYFKNVDGDLKHKQLSPLGAIIWALMPKLRTA